ncbi:MAG: DNA polymerase III subunit chi [Alphaproteobacteria bacterium]|nr:DNA polymerase III subunit chi [Alphaproteobacteria bacterium]
MRVDFYHLQKSSLEQALPALAEKVYSTGKRLLIKTELAEKADYLNTLLWTYRPDSWLPHGSETDGNEADQPILIATGNENANGAEIIMLTDGGTIEEIQSFERCLNLFNGHDETAVQNARVLWKAVVDAECEAYYWQQNDAGKWEMKVSKIPGK